MYYTKNKAGPHFPASLSLEKCTGARKLRKTPHCAIHGRLQHCTELQGLAFWNCGIPFLIGNLTTPKYSIKTAEVDN